MITGNYNNIQNYFLSEEIKKLHVQGFVTKEQQAAIAKENNIIKTSNNPLVRIGFFILGYFVISSCIGLFALIFMSFDNFDIYAICFLLAGILAIIVSETISKRNYFAYGFDDSFILSITLAFAISVGILTEEVVPILMTLVVVNTFCAIRYVHVPSTFFGLLFLIGFIGYLVVEEHIIPSFSLPILLFFVAVGLFFLQYILAKKVSLFLYQNVFTTIKIFSLFVAYASMNYLVVRELSEILLNLNLQIGSDIPMSQLFYFSTFAIPVFYIFYGLKKHDRIFFWMGMVTFALGIATIRYYYSIMPIEVALIIGGIILFAIVYLSIKKTQGKTTGITFNEDKNLNPMAFDLIKTILVNANVNATATTTSPESSMEFGGGGFSGGGSGGNF